MLSPAGYKRVSHNRVVFIPVTQQFFCTSLG